MNIVYLVFGNRLSDHLQAQFSILTFLREATKEDRIHVITTSPQFYARMKEHVNVISITEDKLHAWKGKYNFFWRVKIKAIEYMAELYPGQDMMYVDSDTFLREGGLKEVRMRLCEGKGLMHLDEGHPRNMRTKSLRMWKQIGRRTYGGVTVGMKHDMWNAGVVAIPYKKMGEVVNLALALCDGMLEDDAERVVIEQYSLSIALYENTELVPAEGWIGHYWGNKEQWLGLISDFMLKSYMANSTVADDMAQLGSFPFATTPLYVRKSNTKRRLVCLLDKLFGA